MLKNTLFLISALLLVGILFSCGGNAETKPKNKLDSLNMVLAKDSNNAVALHERAKLYFNGKKYADALKDMSRALDIDSTRTDFFFTMADLYLVMNKSSKAKASLEKIISLDPDNTDAILKLSELYLIVQDFQKALDLSNQALTKNTRLPKGYFTKGMIYLEIGDTAKAQANFLTTVEQDPDYLVAYEELGRIASIKNDPLAEQYYKNALNINPSDVNTHYLLGEFYQKNERVDDAMKEYSTIVQLMPTNRSAHYNMGYLNFVYKQDYAAGVKNFTDAIAADPRYTEAFYMRGLCFKKQGKNAEAKTDFKAALQIDPTFARAAEAIKGL